MTLEGSPALETYHVGFVAQNGIEMVAQEEGYGETCITLDNQHMNSNGIPHGGIYFALADSALGLAQDYVVTNSVTLQANIEFIASAKAGDTLTAICKVVNDGRRVRNYEARITDQDGKLLTVITFIGYRKG